MLFVEMRVVLDTDVVLAGLRSRRGASRAWLRAVLRQEVEIVLSVPLVLQYQDVLLRPRNLAAMRLDGDQVGRLLDGLCRVGRLVEISFLWRPMLRDPDDEMVLEAAVHGRADRLLTFNLRDFVGSQRVGVRVELPGPAWRAWQGRSA
jgi:putative PIN family toxin of toxin-antitoxin system